MCGDSTVVFPGRFYQDGCLWGGLMKPMIESSLIRGFILISFSLLFNLLG